MEQRKQPETVTLVGLVQASRERGRLGLMILLLTIVAGWTDTLTYLFLGKVFASFLTGNILFIGVGIGQHNSTLLLHALTAILAFLIGVTCGTFVLTRANKEQTRMGWYRTFAGYLLVEWAILLVFAILWFVLDKQSQSIQLLLLGIAALGMSIQGALIMAFAIPGVVADALTATVIVLGQRLAQGLSGTEQQNWAWSTLFLVLLCLLYTASALVLALTSASIMTPLIPVIGVTIAIAVLLIPARQTIPGGSNSLSESRAS